MSLVSQKNLKFDIDPEMDEDEIEMASRKLKRSLADMKIKNSSIIQIKGSFRNDPSSYEHSVYVQIIENASLEVSFTSKLLKQGYTKVS